MLPLQSPNIKWTKSVEHPLLYPFNLCSAVFVPLFLFHCFCSAMFCSAIFVPLFLFCWHFCICTWGPHHPMAESPHQFLFCKFCSADLLHLHLPIFVPQFLFCWPFCTCTYQFLFCNFCSADLFALALGVPFTQWPRVPTNFYCSTIFVLLTFLHLHLGSPSPNGQEFPPIFVPQYLFCWPFCTCTWGPRHPMAESPHQFLFHWPFCTCTVPINFCLGDSE